MATWTPEMIAELRRLRLDEDLSFRQTAKRMGITRNAAVGAIQRYIVRDLWGRTINRGGKKYDRRQAHLIRQPGGWTETALTEPYALRKMRKAQLSTT